MVMLLHYTLIKIPYESPSKALLAYDIQYINRLGISLLMF